MKKKQNIWFKSSFGKFGILVILYFLLVGHVVAQQPDWQGEIPSVDITITETRELTLPQADRHFEKIPPRPSEPIRPPIRYDFQSFNFSAPAITPQIRPLKLKPTSPAKVYGGFVRAGYGNYASPLLEGYITSRKDKDKLVGAHFYHSSSGKGPVDGKNSGNGNTKASLFGRSFSEDLVLSGRIDVDNRTTHFYGYPEGMEVDRSDIKQAYNLFKLSGDISNARNTDFSYKLGGQFSYLADKKDAREMEVDINFNSGYKISDESRINIDAAYVLLNRKDAEVDSRIRNLFTVSPSYSFSPTEEFKIKVGLSVAYENDTLDSKNLHVYPAVYASYSITPSIDLLASLDGGMEKVSLQTLSYKNIWIAPNQELYHANKFFELNLGMNAKLGNKMAAKAGFSNATIRNMHFFVNLPNTVDAPSNQAMFDVVYNDGVFYQTNLYGSLSYAQSEKVTLMVRGDVFSYGTGRDELISEAWHLPRYKLSANASFNIAQKLLMNFDIIGQGGMRTFNPETNNIVKLEGAMDINAKVEYLFSPSFSIFAQFNNILGNNYPVFLHYPVRGFQGLGGFTWSF